MPKMIFRADSIGLKKKIMVLESYCAGRIQEENQLKCTLRMSTQNDPKKKKGFLHSNSTILKLFLPKKINRTFPKAKKKELVAIGENRNTKKFLVRAWQHLFGSWQDLLIMWQQQKMRTVIVIE